MRPLAWQGGYGLDLSMRTLYKGCPRLRQGVRGQLEDLRSQERGDTLLLLFILCSSMVGHRGSPNTKAFSKVEELELQDLGDNPEKERLRQPENAEKRAKRKDFLKASP